MQSTPLLALVLLPAFAPSQAQIKHTSIPMGDALTRATNASALTAPGGQPFHTRIIVSEPDNPQSPYQGTIEEWWSSPQQWRRELTAKDGLHQIIVVSNDVKTEQDTGDYLPLWLRRFVIAAFNPVPDAAAWSTPGNTIDQITMPDGRKSDACARAKSTIGSGPRATDAFSNVCFDPEGRLKFYGSPRYSMEFHDYRSFGKKQVPRQLNDNPEPGTALLGSVNLLEDLSKVANASALFIPLDRNDDRFQSLAVSSAILEKLTASAPPIVWPPVHSGNLHGRLGMYVSVDSEGNVREAWPLNSDNAGLQDPAREQVRKWKLPPAVDKTGAHVAVDGPLGFSFDTTIGDPLPELTDPEVRALASNTVDPKWSSGALPSGTIIQVQISVNERGELTGTGYGKVPSAAVGPVNEALQKWTFQPLVRNGHAQYFHGIVQFVVP